MTVVLNSCANALYALIQLIICRAGAMSPHFTDEAATSPLSPTAPHSQWELQSGQGRGMAEWGAQWGRGTGSG